MFQNEDIIEKNELPARSVVLFLDVMLSVDKVFGFQQRSSFQKQAVAIEIPDVIHILG
jgi:hypothetical protein